MDNVVVLIQARAGSTRLPGKVLLPLAGRPALAWVVARSRAARVVGRVVVATTELAADDTVAAVARKAGADCFRGAADDVLGRFFGAARAFPAQHYVRVTADCPLLDPALIDAVAEAHLAGGYDFSYNEVPHAYPRGYDVEVMTAAVLAWLAANCDDAASREHVTPRVYREPERFKTFVMGNADGADYSSLHLALDEEADYELIKIIYERLNPAKGLFGLGEVLALLRAEPALAARARRPRP